MLTMQLYKNMSEPARVSKELRAGPTLTGSLRSESSILDPIILVESDQVLGYNYLYIPELSRYYYITDYTSVRTSLWELSLHVDVLMSWRAELLGVECILETSSATGADDYLTGTGQWVARTKELTDIVTFPSGLSQEGEFILITAGGG